jgi:dTDP-4-amino-4,6-dideoxy-D-galactose acyltransferase
MPDMFDPGCCRFLEWDSQFFNLRIGRLTPNRLTPEAMPFILDWCRANRIDCIYFLADPDDSETTRLTARHEFQLVDIRVTLENRWFASAHHSPLPAEKGVRTFRPDDLQALRDMAGRIHQDSRFFFDPHFPRPRSRALFETWIEKSCADAEGKVFIAEFQGKPMGYIACRRVNSQTGQIDLVGVDGPAQGQGLGGRLVKAALSWFSTGHINQAFVVTQGRNLPAQRVYQKCGFVTQSMQLWHHRWFQWPQTEQTSNG